MTDWDRQRTTLIERLRKQGRASDTVLEAMAAVPRHEFLPDGKRQAAYDDTPLPIGEGQTVSAPHMVAIMADLLDLQQGDRVLEIGTGCGYHAAVTAELVGAENVYTVEYHESLAEKARETLDELGYGDISVRAGDGKAGWPAYAPYDRSYLTCAAPSIPDAVVEQTRPGGMILAPIGTNRQRLVRARRRVDGALESDEHGRVRFVPLQ